MKCHFCSNELPSNIYCIECKNHPHIVRHYYVAGDQWSEVVFDYFDDIAPNKKYSFYFEFNPNHFVITVGKKLYVQQHPILTLDFFPDITPENIAEKFPTILTFL